MRGQSTQNKIQVSSSPPTAQKPAPALPTCTPDLRPAHPTSAGLPWSGPVRTPACLLASPISDSGLPARLPVLRPARQISGPPPSQARRLRVSFNPPARTPLARPPTAFLYRNTDSDSARCRRCLDLAPYSVANSDFGSKCRRDRPGFGCDAVYQKLCRKQL